MKEFLIALTVIVSFMFGAIINDKLMSMNLTCAQAVLHNNVAKCAVYVDKEVLR